MWIENLGDKRGRRYTGTNLGDNSGRQEAGTNLGEETENLGDKRWYRLTEDRNNIGFNLSPSRSIRSVLI